MELLIVRHARPEEQVLEGQTADPGLTDIGHQQAAAAAEYLSTIHIDHVVSSPMLRARQTAAPLIAMRDGEVELIDDLKESDHDSNEYLPVEENRQHFIDQFTSNPDAMFGSDGRDVFVGRVVPAFKKLAADHAGKRVAVFCHGMVTAAFVGHVLGVEDLFSLAPDYTGLTRVKASAGRDIFSLRSFNETMHLRDLPDLRW